MISLSRISKSIEKSYYMYISVLLKKIKNRKEIIIFFKFEYALRFRCRFVLATGRGRRSRDTLPLIPLKLQVHSPFSQLAVFQATVTRDSFLPNLADIIHLVTSLRYRTATGVDSKNFQRGGGL